jgi:LmbE family N-acetylglucosaminyl deacetylase
MRLDFANEHVLAVVAHPDDAELFCAGMLARARADGAAVAILVLCQGDKGQGSVPAPNLAAVRRREVSASARLLGAKVFFGKVPDGYLADTPEQRRILLEVYRRFRPTLVLAHDAADYHADHRAASALAEAASWFCASAGHKTRSPALSTQPALWWMDTMNMTGFVPGLYVDVSQYVGLKREMLACHRSQLERGKEADFCPLEEQMLRQCQARGAQAGVSAAEAFRPHLAWKRARAW